MITNQNTPVMHKFLKCRLIMCITVDILLILLHFYIVINAGSLSAEYAEYVYCLKDSKDIIINCYEIDDLPFSLYHKTQLLNIFNIVSAIATLAFHALFTTLFRRDETLNLGATLILVTVIVTMSCIFAILANIWHIVDISFITNEEIELWNSIDTKFISQYYFVELFVVIHICNTLLIYI